MRKKILVSLLVVLAIVAIAISVLAFRSASDKKLLNTPEDELYLQMSQLDSKQLINIINRIENRYPSMWGREKLLPLYTALIEKANDFSEEQLIALISEKKTLSGIDNAFVEVYCRNGFDPSKLLVLLDDTNIADETKEYIASRGDFSADELVEIFRTYDSRVSVTVIKRLAAAAPDKLAKLVEESISSNHEAVSDEKNRAICLAIAGYYEDCTSKEEADVVREQYAPVLKQFFEQSKSDLVQDEAIYALGRICDNEWFAWIIENTSIDKYTKISVIDRNVNMLKAMVESAKSEDEISSVIEAMKLHPVLDIGDSLQTAIGNGTLSESEELTSLIAFIQKEGMRAVDKYEK